MNRSHHVHDGLARGVIAALASAALLAIVLAGPLMARDVPGETQGNGVERAAEPSLMESARILHE